MTDNSYKNSVALETNPILAKLTIKDDDRRELVILYGFIGKVTEDRVRFYQGLRLGTYFEIARDQIVHAEPVEPTHEFSITKLVVYSSAELTLVKTSTEKWTAGQLEQTIELQNRDQSNGALSHSCHCGDCSTSVSGQNNKLSPRDPDMTRCLPGCDWTYGRCSCLAGKYST